MVAVADDGQKGAELGQVIVGGCLCWMVPVWATVTNTYALPSAHMMMMCENELIGKQEDGLLPFLFPDFFISLLTCKGGSYLTVCVENVQISF